MKKLVVLFAHVLFMGSIMGCNLGQEELFAEVTVEGATYASFAYYGDENMIRCEKRAGVDLAIYVQSSESSTVDSVFAYVSDVSDEGTYSFTYDPESDDHNSVSVELSDSYSYFVGKDTHDNFDIDVVSQCTLSVIAFSEQRLSGSMSCTDLFAAVGSIDYYDDSDGMRPAVDLEMTFTCEVP